MAWDKELEARKILEKEKEVHQRFRVHKDRRPPTPYKTVGYCKESVMHSDFYQWALNSYIHDMNLCLFHIANEGDTGGEIGAIKGGIRKAMGVVPGVPDFAFVGDHPFITFAELKLPGESMNEAQKKLHPKWKERGWRIFIIEDFNYWRYWIEEVCLKNNIHGK